MFRSQCRGSVLVGGVLAAVLSVAPATAQQRGAPMAPPGPTAEQAMAALHAAQEAAEQLDVSLSCAVVDSRGDLIALARMDGARFYTTDVARGKARISALFGQPSGDMADFGSSPAFQSFNETLSGPLYAFQGALPIMRGGEVIGAMGCSGAASQVDEDAVRTALSVF
jgi:glc operon protein GlcG